MARRGRPPKNKVPNTETVVKEEEKESENSQTNGSEGGELLAAPLADRDSLIKRRYRTGTVITKMERSFEIRSIDPKTMLLTRGSAFLPAFNEFLSDPNPDSIADPNIQNFVKEVVISSVTSLKLVDKSLEECSDDETPIEVLDLDERVEIFSAVMELCASEEERAEWKFFPRPIEESTDDQQSTGD